MQPAPPPRPATSVSTKAPGIALMVVGFLGLLVSGVLLLGASIQLMSEQNIRNHFDSLDQSQKELLESISEDPIAYLRGWMQIAAAGTAMGAFLSLIMMFGGIALARQKSRALALAGCIAAALPIQCMSLIGFPVGVWAFIVLLRPSVRDAFAQTGKPTGE